jgi:hypothetical protein
VDKKIVTLDDLEQRGYLSEDDEERYYIKLFTFENLSGVRK